MNWMITLSFVILAYWLGRWHGAEAESKAVSRILDRVAIRLGVPPDDEYWGERDLHKWREVMKRNRETERRSERN